MTATLHVAALQLAQRGLHVFPCQPRGKTPACDTGFHAATTDIERINRWWHAFPDLNIGIATGTISNIFVLDVDGTDGETSLRKLEQTHGALPPTVEAITGKGRHCYYKLGQHKISNSAGVIGAGLDIRGTGGYVLAPPSVHPTGRVYAWSVDGTDEFATAPDWLHALVDSDSAGKAGKPLEHWHKVLTEPIRDGQRNVTLASLTGKYLHMGVNDAFLLFDTIMCINLARCEPPLSADEIEVIVSSVIRRHLRGLRT
jgi:hypothetical protein